MWHIRIRTYKIENILWNESYSVFVFLDSRTSDAFDFYNVFREQLLCLFGYDIECKKKDNPIAIKGWRTIETNQLSSHSSGEMIPTKCEVIFVFYRMFIDVYNTHDTLTQFINNFNRIHMVVPNHCCLLVLVHQSAFITNIRKFLIDFCRSTNYKESLLHRSTKLYPCVRCLRATHEARDRSFSKVPVVIYPLHKDHELKFIKKSFKDRNRVRRFTCCERMHNSPLLH